MATLSGYDDRGACVRIRARWRERDHSAVGYAARARALGIGLLSTRADNSNATTADRQTSGTTAGSGCGGTDDALAQRSVSPCTAMTEHDARPQVTRRVNV